MSGRIGGNRYEPDAYWRFGNRVGAATLVIVGIVSMVASAERWNTGIAVLGVVFVAVGGRWWIRVKRAAVEYDSGGVTIVGVFWTRRIARSSIRDVAADHEWAAVVWRDQRGWWRWTLLSPIATGGGWRGILLVPEAQLEARRRYLKRLAKWARA